MQRHLVVLESKGSSAIHRILVAVAYGLFANLVVHVVFAFAPLTSFVVLYGAVCLCLLILYAVPTYVLYPRLAEGRVIFFALVCSFTLHEWGGLLKEWYLARGLYSQTALPNNAGPAWLYTVLTWCVVVFGVFAGWFAARLIRGKLVVQDGFTCPGCAYNLIGCEERRCSECGYEFSYRELGTTQDEFERRRRFRLEAKPFIPSEERR